jgi:hypothetical protein
MGPFKLFRDFDSNGWNDPSALAQLNTLFLGSSPDLTKLAPRKRREAEGVLDELASLWEQLYRALSSPNDASSKVRAAVGTRVAEVLSKAPAAVEEIPVLSPEEAYTLEVFLDALSGDDRLLIRDINPLASSAESISSKELLKLIISMIKGEVDVPTSVVPVLLECMDSYSLDRPYTPKSLEYYVVLLDEVRDAVNDFESGLYS